MGIRAAFGGGVEMGVWKKPPASQLQDWLPESAGSLNQQLLGVWPSALVLTLKPSCADSSDLLRCGA